MQFPEYAASRPNYFAAVMRACLAVFVCVALSACTISLVPAYDEALTADLEDANKQALVLFAKLENGSPANKFSDFTDSYSELIGAFEDLKQRAETRPMPPLAKRLQKTEIFQSFCNSKDNPMSCLNASPGSMGQVLTTLRMMRDTHRVSGLTAALMPGFKREYETAIRQALTVESALKR